MGFDLICMMKQTRGAIDPMPPPETVLEMPKSVPEKLGARSTWLADNISWEGFTLPCDLQRVHHWTTCPAPKVNRFTPQGETFDTLD